MFTNELMNDIICQYGVLTHLHSDQGANFCSAKIKEISRSLCTHNIRSFLYISEWNGHAECFNQTLEAMLSKENEQQ